MKARLWGLWLILWSASLVSAPKVIYEFSSHQQAQQFTQLTEELRCVVCQNQTIANSNAPLAYDLRELIYHKVVAGESNQAIKTYLLNRYGDFILYRPPLNRQTWLLWFTPAFLLVILSGWICRTLTLRRA